MKSKLRSTFGATLIELLTVAVIIGVVASMAVPRFQRAYERMQFRAANRDIVSSLRLARSMAITDKMQYGVYFDYAEKTVTIFQDVVDPTSFVYDNEDPVIRQDTLTANVEYVFTDVSNNAIIFNPNGSAGFLGGGNITTVGIMESQYLEYYHNVLRSTGRVRSYDTWEAWAEEHAGDVY